MAEESGRAERANGGLVAQYGIRDWISRHHPVSVKSWGLASQLNCPDGIVGYRQEILMLSGGSSVHVHERFRNWFHVVRGTMTLLLHEQDEVTGEFVIKDTIELPAGDIAFVAAGQPHQIWCDGSELVHVVELYEAWNLAEGEPPPQLDIIRLAHPEHSLICDSDGRCLLCGAKPSQTDGIAGRFTGHCR